MAASTLDPNLLPNLVAGHDRRLGIGHDNDALGPGDTSDSGSDVAGLTPAGVDTDSHGTGERASVNPNDYRNDEDLVNVDIEAVEDDSSEASEDSDATESDGDPVADI